MASSSSAAVTGSVPPNQTLYVRNLPDKMGKEALKRSLYGLFSSYGRILDIVALKTMKMRGQAHIVYVDIAAATAAMRGLQNFPFFDQPLKIAYAKSQSNAVPLHLGRYVTAADLAKAKAAARAAKASTTISTGGPVSVPAKRKGDEDEGDGERSKRQKEDDSGSDMDTEDVDDEPPAKKGAAAAAGGSEKPNRILFVSGLPSEATDEMLSLLFSQYAGFKEVRLVPGKTDIAFVEFDTEHSASVARGVLDGFKVTPKDKMTVSYAKVGA